MTKKWRAWQYVVFSVFTSSLSLAGEAVSIGEIRAHPESYHLRIIPIQGTVRKVEVLQPHHPWQPGDPSCYGAYVFELEDGTGSLEISVLGRSGTCNKPIEGESPDVSIGDKVVIQAQIFAPGHYIEEWRSPIPIDRSTTQALAVKIVRK